MAVRSRGAAFTYLGVGCVSVIPVESKGKEPLINGRTPKGVSLRARFLSAFLAVVFFEFPALTRRIPSTHRSSKRGDFRCRPSRLLQKRERLSAFPIIFAWNGEWHYKPAEIRDAFAKSPSAMPRSLRLPRLRPAAAIPQASILKLRPSSTASFT